MLPSSTKRHQSHSHTLALQITPHHTIYSTEDLPTYTIHPSLNTGSSVSSRPKNHYDLQDGLPNPLGLPSHLPTRPRQPLHPHQPLNNQPQNPAPTYPNPHHNPRAPTLRRTNHPPAPHPLRHHPLRSRLHLRGLRFAREMRRQPSFRESHLRRDDLCIRNDLLQCQLWSVHAAGDDVHAADLRAEG